MRKLQQRNICGQNGSVVLLAAAQPIRNQHRRSRAQSCDGLQAAAGRQQSAVHGCRAGVDDRQRHAALGADHVHAQDGQIVLQPREHDAVQHLREPGRNIAPKCTPTTPGVLMRMTSMRCMTRGRGRGPVCSPAQNGSLRKGFVLLRVRLCCDQAGEGSGCTIGRGPRCDAVAGFILLRQLRRSKGRQDGSCAPESRPGGAGAPCAVCGTRGWSSTCSPAARHQPGCFSSCLESSTSCQSVSLSNMLPAWSSIILVITYTNAMLIMLVVGWSKG